jgi:hypothetical protein
MMFCRHAKAIEILERQLAYFQLQFEKERQRAEVAVSALLAMKTQGQVQLPPMPLIADREQDVAREMSDLLKDSEFMQVGS